MANPLTLYSDNVNNMVIALTDTDTAVSSTATIVVQTNRFTAGGDHVNETGVPIPTISRSVAQQSFFASAKAMNINVVCNAVTGTPAVACIAYATTDNGPGIGALTNSNTKINWREIGRVWMTGSAVPLSATIVCTPPGPMTTFIKVGFDSTGGTLDGSNKFTVNSAAFDNGAGVVLAPSTIVLMG